MLEELPGYNHAFYTDQLESDPEDNKPLEFGKYSSEEILAMPGTSGKATLPAQLTLVEEDQIGWKALTFEGNVFFRHKEKGVVQQWLAFCEYVDTGDGYYYQQPDEHS